MKSTTIVCFDLNGSFEEDYIINLEENISLIESPLRILDEFMETHLFLESEKSYENSTKIKYNFKFSNDINDSFDIIVLSDLSYVHKISLESDGYLVFINLEDQNSMDLLDKIIEYVNSCSMEIQTFIVGMYKDKILPIFNKESLNLYLDEKNLNYEYYQIRYESNNNRGRNNHICINNYMLNNENKNEKKRKNGKFVRRKDINKYENNNIADVIELIFMHAYENDEYHDKLKNIKNIKSYLDYEIEKSYSTSGNFCFIY